MITIEVKHDTKHKKWHRLSASILDACPLDTIKKRCHEHLGQYAIDNQMNAGQIAVRALDKNGMVIYSRESDAEANRATY